MTLLRYIPRRKAESPRILTADDNVTEQDLAMEARKLAKLLLLDDRHQAVELVPPLDATNKVGKDIAPPPVA